MSSYRQADFSFFARERADGRLGFWWITTDTDLWADAKTDLKLNFPHHTNLRYDGDAREWTIPLYMRDRLQRWASAWASRQEWNAASRQGYGGQQQRYSGRSQGAQSAGPTSAYAVLHLLPTAPPELVTAAYRMLAQLCHPDHGGDTQMMMALNEAVATLRDGATRRTS